MHHGLDGFMEFSSSVEHMLLILQNQLARSILPFLVKFLEVMPHASTNIHKEGRVF
jgi:hypothetical protein